MTDPRRPDQAAGPRVVTVVQHEDGVPLDLFEQWLAPLEIRVLRAHRGDPIPTGPADVGDGLIVLGGTMDAYADDVAPWLPATRALLAAVAAADDVPALGICLGAQLLAVACGGHVDVGAAPGREVGAVEVSWGDAAGGDPLVGALARHPRGTTRFPTMHSDAVTRLPDGAVPLGSSSLYPHQAFRVGGAWGCSSTPRRPHRRSGAGPRRSGTSTSTSTPPSRSTTGTRTRPPLPAGWWPGRSRRWSSAARRHRAAPADVGRP
ncbi:type 1 glutamine amidotransferase [Cellulomonas sp. ATA003]|uniref:type 1 glutamine amidotransferase n=1 Tax=Cellulomonas sp. ATA003 TaxID=3073064 RepID=UPI0028739251|nr:type 1 glutamine amidotransferase [Cellulomonas sp. ATA003]WNB85265.1 type 1 glutamine amidotransferase [Cellulomonas sp. ATA003]